MIIKFNDYPDFKPNLTPYDIFKMGSFGGTYFRKIKSPNTGIVYENNYKKFDFFKKLDEKYYKSSIYDINLNKYKVKTGMSYEYWMEKGWINEKIDPYGWIEWYCNFYYGRRTIDDNRQIKRWLNIAGSNGRFRKQLQNKINNDNKNDETKYLKIRQLLLHWAFDSSKLQVI